MGSFMVPVQQKVSMSWRDDGWCDMRFLRTLSACIERLHVKDVDALHLSEDFETLETGGLVNVGGDGTGLGTSGHKVVLILDLCFCATSTASVQLDEGGEGWRQVERTLEGLDFVGVLAGLGIAVGVDW